MIPGAFDYLAPRSVEETVALLAQHGEDAKVLAGGQSLIPAMNFRLARPAVLIDINGIEELADVRRDSGGVRIGALRRYHQLERDTGMMEGNFFRPRLMYLVGAEVSERNCKEEKHHCASQSGNCRAISLPHLEDDNNHSEPCKA